MNNTNTPQFDNYDNQQDYAIPDQNPAMPAYPITVYEEAKQTQFYELITDEVNFMPASEQIVEGALQSAIAEAYRDLNQISRIEVIMDPNITNVSQTELDSMILARVNQKFDDHLHRTVESILAYLSATNLVQSRTESQRYVVDETNAAQIGAIILGTALTVSDTGFTELLDRITDDQLIPGDYDQVFNYISQAGPNALLETTNLISTQIRNQGLTTLPDSADKTVKVSLLLQIIDTQEFFEFAVTKMASNPSQARMVILELVKMPPPKGIPSLVANSRLAQLALDLPETDRAQYENLIMEINQINPIQITNEMAQAAQTLNDATELPRDITNAALDGGKVAALGSYLYLIASSLVGFAIGTFTRNPTMAVSSLIVPIPAMVAAGDIAAGNEAFQSVTTTLREQHYSEDNQRVLAERQAQQRLSFTVRGSSTLANFFASSRVIQLINMNSNPAEGQQFNLDNFERQLTDPQLRSIYFQEFAGNYSTNRPQLVQAMGEIAADYATLEVNDFNTFVRKVALPNGVDSTLLNDLSGNDQ